jgi:hypothetical protein
MMANISDKARHRKSFNIITYMQRMMFLLLTGKFQHGEDNRILHQKIIDGGILLFPMDAEDYEEDDDDQETNHEEECSQVVSGVDRKALGRSGSHGASPKEPPETAQATREPMGDTDVWAALGTTGAKLSGARPPTKAARPFVP